jgi:hypothetical protein
MVRDPSFDKLWVLMQSASLSATSTKARATAEVGTA